MSAELTQFILGVIGEEFSSLKTADGFYLKDLLMGDIGSSLVEYNSMEAAFVKMVCRRYDDASSQKKTTIVSDQFEEISEIGIPAAKTTFDVWNQPCPIKRLGTLTYMTRERITLMTADQLINWHNAKLEADLQTITKNIIRMGMTKVPSPVVDALDQQATYPKAAWNAEASMDIPPANGQIIFTNTHQHYNTAANIGSAGANLDTYLLNNVSEHKYVSGAQLILWAASNATVNLIKNETTNFRPVNQASEILGTLSPEYVSTGRAQAVITGAKYLGHNVKIVGTWKEAIVIESPELPANYIWCTAYLGDNNANAPIGWREHPQFKGLRIMEPNDGNPLIGKEAQYRRYLGLTCNQRSAMATLFITAGSWAEPSIV